MVVSRCLPPERAAVPRAFVVMHAHSQNGSVPVRVHVHMYESSAPVLIYLHILACVRTAYAQSLGRTRKRVPVLMASRLLYDYAHACARMRIWHHRLNVLKVKFPFTCTMYTRTRMYTYVRLFNPQSTPP